MSSKSNTILRVVYGIWAILALTSMVLNTRVLMEGGSILYFWGTVFQLFVLVFVIVQYRRLDREAARRRRQARRTRRNDPHNWSV